MMNTLSPKNHFQITSGECTDTAFGNNDVIFLGSQGGSIRIQSCVVKPEKRSRLAANPLLFGLISGTPGLNPTTT